MEQLPQPDIIYTDPTWLKVKEWLEGEYVHTLTELSGLTVTEKKGDQLRGKAAFIKMLLDFEPAVYETA